MHTCPYTQENTSTHRHIHTQTYKLRWGRICSVSWAYFACFIFTEEDSPPGSDLPSFKKVETGYGLINLLMITHIVRINTRFTYFSTSFKNTVSRLWYLIHTYRLTSCQESSLPILSSTSL